MTTQKNYITRMRLKLILDWTRPYFPKINSAFFNADYFYLQVFESFQLSIFPEIPHEIGFLTRDWLLFFFFGQSFTFDGDKNDYCDYFLDIKFTFL